MKNINISRKIGIVKYKFFDNVREHKKLTLFIILFCLIGILTGIFTGIKYLNGASLISFNDFSLSQYLSGELGSQDLFFSRLLSSSIILIIISFSTFCIYLTPINLILLTYRGYLLSLNCTLIIVLNGLGGILSCLLIIIPCQILSLIILSLYCSYAFKTAYIRKKYGTKCKSYKILLLTFLLLLLLNGIETLLLYLFSSNIILII